LGGSALIFVQIEGEPLYSVLLKRFGFLFTSKTFYWGKEKTKYSRFAEMEIKKVEKDKIKMKRESRLRNLITQIETRRQWP
jgi:hypothetical protein